MVKSIDENSQQAGSIERKVKKGVRALKNLWCVVQKTRDMQQNGHSV